VSHDVFVSYAEEDRAIADRLVASLEEKGVCCWFAPRDNAPGSPFEGGIVKAIDQSSLFIIVLSRSSNASNYVQKEVALTVKRDVPICAFRIEDFALSDDMELYLGNIHWYKAETLTPDAILKFTEVVLDRLRMQRVREVEARVPAQPLFGRDEDVQKILGKLTRNSLAVIGMQGIGKSKVVSAVFEKLASNWPSGFKTLYWRRFKQEEPPAFSSFGRSIIQEHTRDHVEFDRLSVSDQVEAVLQVLRKKQALVVVDQFESVVDSRTRIPKDPGFARFLSALINQDVGAARVLFTSREAPMDERGLSFPHYLLSGLDAQAGLQLATNPGKERRNSCEESSAGWTDILTLLNSSPETTPRPKSGKF
jgi:hypothetical protein